MAIKLIDPDDSYIVRLMFGCGHGHCMPPGFTHWEAGEGCIWTHADPEPIDLDRAAPGPTDNASAHLYGRLMAVPIVDSGGGDCWERICSDPNKWCHFPMAPEGAKEGERIGTKLKLREGATLQTQVEGEIVYS